MKRLLVLILFSQTACGGCAKDHHYRQADGSLAVDAETSRVFDNGVNSEAGGASAVYDSGADRPRPEDAWSDAAHQDSEPPNISLSDGEPASGSDGGPDTLNCAQTLDCLLANRCRSEDNSCLNTCYEQGTAEAKRLILELASCALNYCPDLLSYDRRNDLLRCIDTYCRDQFNACLNDTSGGRG